MTLFSSVIANLRSHAMIRELLMNLLSNKNEINYVPPYDIDRYPQECMVPVQYHKNECTFVADSKETFDINPQS